MKRVLAVLVVSSLSCGFSPVEERLPAEAPVTEAPPLPAPVEQQPTPLEPVTLPVVRPDSGELRRVVKDATTPIDLELNEGTVFCSAIGYGVAFLKVSMPQLDALAHFDHRVEASGLPCAAVGACDELLGPDTVLQGQPGVERVAVRVTLVEVLRFDRSRGRCTRQLQEDVFTVVRGVTLRHHAEDQPVAVGFGVCAAGMTASE